MKSVIEQNLPYLRDYTMLLFGLQCTFWGLYRSTDKIVLCIDKGMVNNAQLGVSDDQAS